MRTQTKHLTNSGKVMIRVLLVGLVLSLAAPVGLAAPLRASGGISSLGVVQQWSVSAPDPGALDEFGYAVALEGNTAVVGARNADPNQGGGPIDDAGAAFVYVYDGKTWVLDGELSAKNAEAGDTFGVSVAISGNTILVGATGVDLEDPDQEDDEAKDAGAAYIFTRTSEGWEQQARLTASDRAEDDSFGSTVALYRDTAVIASQNKTFNIGSAYVFGRDGGGKWSQRAQLCGFSSTPFGKLCTLPPVVGEVFGASLAVYGNRIAVGATQSGPGVTAGEGVVYLFQRSDHAWEPETVLEAEEGQRGDGFGNALALQKNTVVVGASHADPDLGGGRITSAGAAYVFSDTGNEWEETAYLTAANSLAFDQFGEAVDIDGDTLVVGADGATQMGNAGAGAVYVFKKAGSGWSLQTRAVTNPAGEDDLFGKSVALSRGWFVAGASGRDPGSHTRAGEAFLNKLGAVQLPSTGFAPGVETSLPAQPGELAYADEGGMTLEIPALGESLSVVGVPKSGSGWDVRWLGGEAGYLEGTAFPTWQGNSALAAHATLADGQPGPFAELEKLRWGDRVVVRAWGQEYVYEVRQNSLVVPGDVGVLRHEDLSWLTLVTCQGFDGLSNAFRWRRVVRAVLVAVQD